MDKWYAFDSIESFNTWHDNLKSELGYPLPSIDSEGNIIGEPFSTDYTSVIKVADNDFRAVVEDEYAEGLTLSEQPIFEDKMEKHSITSTTQSSIEQFS
jgi:hypothetical protein